MKPPAIITCGILLREVTMLAGERYPETEVLAVDSSLHIAPELLHRELKRLLESCRGRRTIAVFGGCCHPAIDSLLERYGVHRTCGQNCVEILLGRDEFLRHLERGVFFLLEDWVLRWDEVMSRAFGPHPEIVQEILSGEHRCFLALRTPQSGDFRQAAEALASRWHLPLRWEPVSLDRLGEAIDRAIGTQS